ncbi:toxin-antitoxin system YwqK family antitoxin [Helicobacter sp. 23-1045]
MRNGTFNKIGKIVAVASGIVLMGAVFSGCGFFDSMMGGDSTSAQSSSTTSSESKKSDSGVVSSFLGGLFGGSEKESVKREKCSGSGEVELQQTRKVFNGRRIVYEKYKEKGTCKSGVKEGVWKSYDSTGYIVLQESTYKKGILDGVTKIYDEDENLIKELPYKNGKLNGTATAYKAEGLESFTKVTIDYVDDKAVITRAYKDNNIALFLQTKIENGIEITRTYNTLTDILKELNKTLSPKLKAKYEQPLKEAMKKDGQNYDEYMECNNALNEVGKYNRGEIRIKPSYQTIQKAQECQSKPKNIGEAYGAYVNSFNEAYGMLPMMLGADGTETKKVKAQIGKEYDNALIAEFKKHNFSDDAKVLAFIKDKYPEKETISKANLKIDTTSESKGLPWAQQQTTTTTLYQGSEIGTINYNTQNTQNACVAKNGGNCRAFSRQFKELIDKSAFKDKIYNLLPKPKNQ